MTARRHRAGPQHGLTLIELMIALTLGLVLIAAVYRVFMTSSRTAVTTDALSRRQEAIRYVGARLSEDARMAGFRGCGGDQGEIPNLIAPDPATSGGARTEFTHTDFRYRFDRYVEGFDAVASAWNPTLPAGIPTPQAGTDVLTLRGPVDEERYTILDMATTDDALRINPLSPMPLAAGDLALVADCLGAAIFQVSSSGTASAALPGGGVGTVGVIEHQLAAGTPGNWRLDLGRAFPRGAQVWRLATISYYIAPSTLGTGGALWRSVDGVAAELAPGVDQMQILYGEDTDDDRVADVYRPASAFADSTAWRRVAALRVALLFSGTRDGVGVADNRTFDLLGTAVGPFTDRRLRRAVTLTIALRNRLP